jgi:hypothetical protein
MKNLNTYLTEKKKTFELNIDERRALGILIGTALGNLGEDDEIKQFKKFMDSLSDDEKKQFDSLYDVFENTENYKKINQKVILPEDLELIKKFYDFCYNNDIMQDNDFDAIDAFEKICL